MADRLRIDFDGNWKSITSEMLPDFIAFFMPDLYEDLDLDVPYEFLEQEFIEVTEHEKTKNITDKLVKFRLKNGEEKWVFIHIEFQNDGSISERMFNYYRRIYDKYGQYITAIVVYTGKKVPKNHNKFEIELYGTRLLYEFNTYTVSKQKEHLLLLNPNPFSVVVLANLYVNNTKRDFKKRLVFKEYLYQIAKNRGYSFEKTSNLYTFVLQVVKLPLELEIEYINYVKSQDNPAKDMRLIEQVTIDFANEIIKDVIGKSAIDLQIEILERDSELRERDAELELQSQKMKQSILNLRASMNLTDAQIVSITGMDIVYVQQVLENL